MTVLQKIMAASVASLLCLCLGAGAFASSESGAEPSWDEITARVIEEYGADVNRIAAGYLNLVTGEEHYINGDEYFVAASMYKVPLCMYCTESIANGAIDWDIYGQYYDYDSLRDAVLINSDNEKAATLFNVFLGGYDSFRLLTAPYMGVEPGSEPRELTTQNFYTAREFIHCLKLLYDEQERFPGIIETMRKSKPNRYFTLNEPRFEIAHKPGWLNEYNVPVRNDCCIAFTTQPIALVLFTKGSFTSEEFLSAWCTAMCDYTERQAACASPLPGTAGDSPVSAADAASSLALRSNS